MSQSFQSMSVLHFRGAHVSDNLAKALLYIAALMSETREEQKVIRSKTVEGKVYTQFKTATMGFLGGTLFNATIEHPGGKTTVSFIVDLDALMDTDIPAPDELRLRDLDFDDFGPN